MCVCVCVCVCVSVLEVYYTSPITPTIISPSFNLFLSHKALIKFKPLYVTQVSCFPLFQFVNSLSFFHSGMLTLTIFKRAHLFSHS